MKSNVIDNILNKVSIVEEISQFVTLTKKGQNNIGICPFHDDNNPSFTVNEDKKIFKCFVCGVGGNVIKFNQMWNNYTFSQAVINLGEKYNIDVSTYKKRNLNNPYFDENKKSLIELNTNVNEIFLQMLRESKNAQKYLQTRNLSKQTIEFFKIGYKNETLNEISELLTQTNIDYKTQEKSGLVIFTKDKIIDFFKDRITIPICDEFNNIVGFGSRILTKNSNQVKYLNTKQSELFQKNEILFNFYNAKTDIYNNNKNNIIVVEGYMDVISLHNQNIFNVVGVMTNNITNKQVEKLMSLKKQIVLCLDFDQAGIQGTYDFIQKYPQLNIKIVKLEKNLDPDEYINKYTREKFVEQLTNPLSVDNFLLEIETLDIKINKDKHYFETKSLPVNNQQDFGNDILKPDVFNANESYLNSFSNLSVDDFEKHMQNYDTQNNTISVNSLNSKTESEMVLWICEKHQKYMNEEIFNKSEQGFVLSYENKQLIRLEYSVLKWYINNQIKQKRLLEYLQILNTKILKKWIIMLIENKTSLDTVKQTIKNSPIEAYSEKYDSEIFELIKTWHNFNLEISHQLNMSKQIKNDIINRSVINELINKQRNTFLLARNSLKH